MTDFAPDEAQGREAPLAKDALPTDVIDYENDPMPSNENLSNRPHRRLKDIKKLPTGPPTTRYLTFTVQNLPSLRLLGKNDPMITVWDSYMETYIGTTEVVKQVLSTEFEEVIAVKHYPGVDQTLHCSVFNASGNAVTIKDLIGTSTTSLDTLLGLEGTDVPMSVTHSRDPKINAKLTKAKASITVHLRAHDTYASVLKSGWMLVRELPLFMGTKEVTPLLKRFMVISKGRIAHYRTVYDFFQEGATGKTPPDKFSLLMTECKLAMEQDEPRLWAVDCEKLSKRFEFILTDLKEEPPNLGPDGDDIDGSNRGLQKPKQELDFAQRKALWLNAVQANSVSPQRPPHLDTTTTSTGGNPLFSPTMLSPNAVLSPSKHSHKPSAPAPPHTPAPALPHTPAPLHAPALPHTPAPQPTKEHDMFHEVMEEVLEVVPKIEPSEVGGGGVENESFVADDEEETKQPSTQISPQPTQPGPGTTTTTKPLPSSPAITRYLTLKVKNLPSLFLIAKPDPMLMLWDSVLCAYVGKTEIVRQAFSADFEQVFAVKHYPNHEQSLTVNVFSVSGEKVTTKDVVGRALVTLDSLLGMEGVDVSVPITNLKDPKMHTKLVKSKSAVVFHLRPEVSLYSVIHSGWVLTREVPSAMQKKDKPPPFVRRFLVVLQGRMQHYKSVIDYFEDTTAGVVSDRVVISLSESGPIVYDHLPKPAGKLALDGRRAHAWAVECTLTGKRHEFDIVEQATAEAPNLAPEQLKERLSAEVDDVGRPSLSNVTSLDSPRSSNRRDRWLQAMRLAIPAKVATPTNAVPVPARPRAPSGVRPRSPSAPAGPPPAEKTPEKEQFGEVMQEVLDVVPKIDGEEETPRIVPPVIEEEAEAPPLQDSKVADEAANKARKKKVPTQPGVIRYLTFRIKDLPAVRLLTKNDPMVTVWDTHIERYTGTTEVKPQTYSPDFEEVISVCHYLDIDQMLRVGVFNASGNTVTSKDFIGNSVIPLDTLLNFEGSEVPIPISNARDPKLHLKLQKSKSSIVVHLRSNSHLAGILKSGHVHVRTVPKKGRPSPWAKRFLVLVNGQLSHYRCLYDFFQDCSQTRAELDKVVVSLNDRVALVDVLPKVPGAISKAESWGVDCEAEGKRYEFELIDHFLEEFPNLCPQAEPISQRTANSIVQDSKQPEVSPTRRLDWVRATLVAIPTTLFGVPLALSAARSDPERAVPSPITVAIKWLDENALTEMGLYRIPGGKTEVETLIARFDRGEEVEIPKQYFGGNLASLIVQFIRRLPESIFTVRMSPVFEQMSQDGQIKMLKLLLSKLPRANFCTLRALIQHLVRVAENSNINEMTIENLSICVITSMAQTMNALMTNVDFLFDQPEPQE